MAMQNVASNSKAIPDVENLSECPIRRKYQLMTTVQLVALDRQWKRARQPIDCEFGHYDCGCSTVAGMNGGAPCHEAVLVELGTRRR